MAFTKHYPEESDFKKEHRLLWRTGYGGLSEVSKEYKENVLFAKILPRQGLSVKSYIFETKILNFLQSQDVLFRYPSENTFNHNIFYSVY